MTRYLGSVDLLLRLGNPRHCGRRFIPFRPLEARQRESIMIASDQPHIYAAYGHEESVQWRYSHVRVGNQHFEPPSRIKAGKDA
jgi:hypothetical protein